MKNRKNMLKTTVLIGFVLIFSQTGCSTLFSETKINKKYNEKKMQTLTGKKIVLENRKDIYADQEFGFGFVIPESLRSLNEAGFLEILPQSENLTFFTLYSKELFPLVHSLNLKAITDEQQWIAFTAEAEKYAFSAAFLLCLPAGELAGEDADVLKHVMQSYSVCEKMVETKRNVYYYGYNTDYSQTVFSDDEKNNADTVIAELKNLKENIFVFPPLPRQDKGDESGNTGSGDDLSLFSAQTLDGKTLTQDIFSSYKVTMINVWATWCGPCVREMPELAKLHASMLPANTNMISICTDAADDPAAAKDVLSSVSAGFATLVPNSELTRFLNTVSAVPTTVFVDSRGKFIGNRITGVPRSNPAESYAQIMRELLIKENER